MRSSSVMIKINYYNPLQMNQVSDEEGKEGRERSVGGGRDLWQRNKIFGGKLGIFDDGLFYILKLGRCCYQRNAWIKNCRPAKRLFASYGAHFPFLLYSTKTSAIPKLPSSPIIPLSSSYFPNPFIFPFHLPFIKFTIIIINIQ